MTTVRNNIVLLSLLMIFVVTSCRDYDDIVGEAVIDNDDDEYDPDQVDTELYPDWSEATHSNAVDPNFEEVFFDGDEYQWEVQRLDITISSSNWSKMWSDLSSNLSSSNRMGVSVNSVDFTPVWVPCTVSYNGIDWYEVGVRFKGNSSLLQTYTSNNTKMSLKLDFDQYEESYPALTNQRFYGFKQLNLNNNYEDSSFMREKVATDLFREFGMVAAHTSFCEVYIDYGSGSQYFGLYTIVEEVDDTVIKSQFGDDSGNIYKPDEDAGSFASGSYDTSEFELKNNMDVADYSDVRSLYDLLHSSQRSSDTEAWMADLEAIFDVDTFMKWLAVNTTIQNWDSYGNMAHNYYLYNNPATGMLTWIPWDHNESMQSATGNYTCYEPSALSRVSTYWPLIRYLIEIDEYKAIFDGYLREFIDGVFSPSRMVELYGEYESLLQSSVSAERSGCTFLSSTGEFNSAVSTLESHVQSRYNSINSYLE